MTWEEDLCRWRNGPVKLSGDNFNRVTPEDLLNTAQDS
jgi:hypothetical protein